MAKRMQTVDLSKAWLEFWPILFPETDDWSSSLQEWVRFNLIRFDEKRFHLPPRDPTAIPQWGDNLSVSVDERNATISLDGHYIGECPWFAAALREAAPQWRENHPFDRLGRHDSRNDDTTRQLIGECQKMGRNVTLGVGGHLLSRVTEVLRERKLIATGLFASDGYPRREDVSTEQLKMMTLLNMRENRIELPPSLPMVTSVLVRKNPDYKENSRKGGSIAEDDAILIEEMHALKLADPTLSNRGAAGMVLNKAPRRTGAEDASVVERLCRKYGAKYPARRRR